MDTNQTNQAPTVQPNSHMPMAIISTVISAISCMVPSLAFGIVSIVYASKVKTKYESQDFEGAKRASKNAKTWWIVSIVSFIVLWAAGLIFMFVIAGDTFWEEFEREMERQQQMQQ
ncbi:MAG: CD225/dispanin family protein [Psychroflexus sp.]